MEYTEIIQGAHVLHSPQDKLLSIIALKNTVVENLLKEVTIIANNNNYSKISAIIPRWCVNKFLRKGYSTEAIIPKFYKGKVDGYFLGKFLSHDRSVKNSKSKPATDCSRNIILDDADNFDDITVDSAAPETAAQIISGFMQKSFDGNYCGGKYELPEYTQRKHYTFSKASKDLAVVETIENSLWGTAFISKVATAQDCNDEIYAYILEKLSQLLIEKEMKPSNGLSGSGNAQRKFKTIYSNICSSTPEKQKDFLDRGFKSAGVLKIMQSLTESIAISKYFTGASTTTLLKTREAL